MIKMYEALIYAGGKIIEIEAERSTEKSIWVKGKLKFRETSYSKIFDTYSEAKEFIISRKSKDVADAKRRLEFAEKELISLIAKL